MKKHLSFYLILSLVAFTLNSCLDFLDTGHGSISNVIVSDEGGSNDSTEIPGDAEMESSEGIVGADIPVTIAKLDAQEISAEHEGDSSQLNKITLIHEANASDGPSQAVLVGHPGAAEVDLEVVLEKSDDDYFSFVPESDGSFRLSLPEDYLEQNLKLHYAGDVEGTKLTFRVDSSGFLVGINSSKGLSGDVLYAYNDYLYFNQIEDGVPSIALQNIHGGEPQIFAYTNLDQMYYFPELKQGDVVFPAHIFGLNQEGSVMNVESMQEPAELNNVSDLKIGNNAVLKVIDAKHSPQPLGLFTIYYGVFQYENTLDTIRSPLILLPYQENAPEILLIDSDRDRITSRDMTWADLDHVISLNKYEYVLGANDDDDEPLEIGDGPQDAELMGEENLDELVANADNMDTIEKIEYVAESYDLSEFTQMMPKDITEYLKTHPSPISIESSVIFTSDKPIYSPASSHYGHGQKQHYLVFSIDEGGVTQLGISDYENEYLLTNAPGGTGHVSVSMYNDFVAYDTNDPSTGLQKVVIKHLPTMTTFSLIASDADNKIQVFNPVFSQNKSHSLSYFYKTGDETVHVGVINLLYHPKVMKFGLVPRVDGSADGEADVLLLSNQNVDYSHLKLIETTP